MGRGEGDMARSMHNHLELRGTSVDETLASKLRPRSDIIPTQHSRTHVQNIYLGGDLWDACSLQGAVPKDVRRCIYESS